MGSIEDNGCHDPTPDPCQNNILPLQRDDHMDSTEDNSCHDPTTIICQDNALPGAG